MTQWTISWWAWTAVVVVGAGALQRGRRGWAPTRVRVHRISKRWPRRDALASWRARRTGDDNLAEVVEQMAASLRSGRALSVALSEARVGAGSRLGREIDAVLADTASGVSFSAALEAWSRRQSSREVHLLVMALTVGMEVGGARAQVLEEVAEAIRERHGLVRDAERQATQARLSAWVVALAPLGFAAVAFLSNPRAARFLVGTPLGGICLAAGLGLDAVGAWWMRALGRRAAWLS